MMNVRTISVFGLTIAVACGTMVYAQDSTASSTNPKVLQIVREWEKPGKGADHDKTEGAYVAALRKSNSTSNYFAACAVTGKPRCLYFQGFDSYAAWEKDTKTIRANKELSAQLDAATKDDVELLEGTESAVFSYLPAYSYKDSTEIASARYIEVDSVRVRPGHHSEFRELVKMFQDGNEKGKTSAHWSVYHLDYGGNPEVYDFFSADKSFADIDKGMMESDKFWAALGESGHKRFEELYAASVESEISQILAINPAQSFPPDSWVKADPTFWTVKTEEAPAPKSKEKKK